MRRVLHGDIVAAARMLLTLSRKDREAAFVRLVERAHAADLYRRRVGRAHPHWGDGTLRAAVLPTDLPPEPPLSNGAYLDCLLVVLSGLSRRAGYPRAQEMHFGVAGSSSSRFAAISSPQSVQKP